MDTLPPPQVQVATAPSPPPPAYVYGPGSIYPEPGKETELCNRASSFDWLYTTALIALDAGAMYAELQTKYMDTPVKRTIGPALVGLTWGGTVSGIYLALPKCEPHWVGFAPREGNVREHWQLGLTLAILAGVTAPVIMGIVNGIQPVEWSTTERSTRVIVSGVMGFGGALIPYLLPPKTWSAARQLEKIRADVTNKGAFISYGIRF